MNRGLLLMVVLVGVGLVGCSGGGSQPAAGQAAAEPQPVAVPVDASPDQVVSVFLSALRSGDKATTAHLLTTRAREETAKHGWAVDPKGSPNTKYQIHAAEILPENPNGSHVTSVWTETYSDGTITYQIVWVLRRETPGWRIAGMALELMPGQPPSFLNFEDPADMERKQLAAIEAAEKEEAALAAQQAAQQPAIETAQVPGSPGTTTPQGPMTTVPPTTLPPTSFLPTAAPPANELSPPTLPPGPAPSQFQPVPSGIDPAGSGSRAVNR